MLQLLLLLLLLLLTPSKAGAPSTAAPERKLGMTNPN